MKVRFLCSGNAHRSPLAEALLKKMMPDLDVDSAGLHVVIPVSEQVREYLAKENAARHLKKAPQSIAQKKLRGYNLIVAMEKTHKTAVLELCPECKNAIDVWNVEDPYYLSHEEAMRIARSLSFPHKLD